MQFWLLFFRQIWREKLPLLSFSFFRRISKEISRCVCMAVCMAVSLSFSPSLFHSLIVSFLLILECNARKMKSHPTITSDTSFGGCTTISTSIEWLSFPLEDYDQWQIIAREHCWYFIWAPTMLSSSSISFMFICLLL
jgi:hypothetical protein